MTGLRGLAALAGVAGSLCFAVPANAFTGVSSTTAFADVLAAMQADPSLATPAADFSTPALKAEFGQVAGDVSWMDKAYAGASANPAQTILSDPTFTSAESAVETSLGSSASSVPVAGVTEALVGGEAVDAAAGAGLLSAVALPGALAVGAGALVYMDITTGSNPISVALFGQASDPAAGGATTGANQVVPDSLYWAIINLPPTATNYTMGSYLGNADLSPGASYYVPLPSQAQAHEKALYVLVGRYPGGVQHVAEQIFTAQPATEAGPFIDPDTYNSPQSGVCWPAPQRSVAGWPPVAAGARTIFAPFQNNSPCAATGGASVVRDSRRMPTGFPRPRPSGSSASGSATAHPLGGNADLAAAIRGLGAAIADGNHDNLAQLFNNGASTGANLPGVVSVSLPSPTPGEVVTHYVGRLQTAGFTHVTTTVLTSPNTSVGPDVVVSVTPATPTVGSLDTPIEVKANPSDAPAAGLTPGQSIGSPGCSLSPPTSSVNLSPLTSLNFGSSFPFSVLPWVTSVLSGVVTQGQRPQATFSVFGTTVSTGDSLAPLDSVFSALRTFLAALLWLGVVWSLWRRTFGGAREV